MGAIADLSDLIYRASGGGSGTRENIHWFKTGRVNGVQDTGFQANRPNSLWRIDGYPAGGNTPTSGAIPDNTTPGSLLQATNTAGFQKWFYNTSFFGTNAGTIIWADRLFHNGGLDGTVTTAQTVQGSPASPALTRYNTASTCIGNIIAIEIYTAVGSSSIVVNASYTNQAGVSGRTTKNVFMGGTANSTSPRMIFLPLQAGDTGVLSVQTVTLANSTLTAGNFGITIFRPLAVVGTEFVSSPGFRDFTVGLPGIPEVVSGACLFAIHIPNFNGGQADYYGTISLVEA